MRILSKYRRVLLAVATALLLLVPGLMAAVGEVLPDNYSHGTIGISSELGNSIALEVGESATIEVTPYAHRQYTGCLMPGCPSSCDEMEEEHGEEEHGVECFEKGLGCSCSGDSATTRYADVSTAVSGDSDAVSVDDIVADGAGSLNTGDTANGFITVTALAPGTAELTVSAVGHDMNGTTTLHFWNSAQETFTITVNENEEDENGGEEPGTGGTDNPAPDLEQIEVSFTSTPTLSGGNATFTMSGATDDWRDNVTAVYVDGNLLESSQYTLEASRLILNRTSEEPIILPADRSTTYPVVIEAEGYADVETGISVTSYGARSFQVRVVDVNTGEVYQTTKFDWEQMESMMTAEDVYYPSICGMAGLRTFKAQGVYMEDLLSASGVEASEGMILQLRTNDMAKTGNDSEDELAYYGNGRFTYEKLLGQSRYYFPGVFDEEVKTAILAQSNMNAAVRQLIGESDEVAAKVEVKPMLALNYVETTFKSTNGASPENLGYSNLITNERSFRFLFGLAMSDQENEANMIANETTTFSVSYCCFGLDVLVDEWPPTTPTTPTPEGPKSGLAAEEQVYIDENNRSLSYTITLDDVQNGGIFKIDANFDQEKLDYVDYTLNLPTDTFSTMGGFPDYSYYDEASGEFRSRVYLPKIPASVTMKGQQ